jgi:hypothetical protein
MLKRFARQTGGNGQSRPECGTRVDEKHSPHTADEDMVGRDSNDMMMDLDLYCSWQPWRAIQTKCIIFIFLPYLLTLKMASLEEVSRIFSFPVPPRLGF